MPVAAVLVALAVLLAAVLLWRSHQRYRRIEFIRTYTFPKGLFDKLAARRPELQRRDIALVSRGLRHFFLAYLRSGRQFVAMPSQVADDLWHEFILYTRNYEAFCRQAFGGFLHHTPAVALRPEQRDGNAGLRRVWWQCCREENIHPQKPTRLPLLFALDAKLGIKDGFHYAADCTALRAAAGAAGATGAGGFCGGDFSDASIDGGTSGFGDGAASAGLGSDGSGDGGGDAGGCGGGGCGGGGD